MAVVATNYIRRGKAGNPRAKDAIRYMQHRRGYEGAKITPVAVWDRREAGESGRVPDDR